MSIITMYAASKLPNSPSKPYLSKQSHKEPPPGYFVLEDGSLKIDTDSEDWKLIISTRKIQNEIGVENGLKTSDHKTKQTGNKNGKTVNKKSQSVRKSPETVRKVIKTVSKGTGTVGKSKKDPPPKDPPPEDPELIELRKESVKAVYKEKLINVEKKENDVIKQRIAINKESKQLIQYDMAEFLFFGYMEKLNYSLVRLPKKLKPILVNLLKEGNLEGVVKKFSKEIEKIIIETKRTQAKDLEDWQNDK